MEQTVEKVRAELEAIRGGKVNKKIADELIHPLYFKENNYGVKVDENGKTIARKKTKDSEWIYL